MRQHAAERMREGDALAGQRREIELALEAAARLLGGHHFEELLLPRGLAHRGEQLVVLLGPACWSWRDSHGHGLTGTLVPTG